jgi:hypothetical protein
LNINSQNLYSIITSAFSHLILLSYLDFYLPIINNYHQIRFINAILLDYVIYCLSYLLSLLTILIIMRLLMIIFKYNPSHIYMQIFLIIRTCLSEVDIETLYCMLQSQAHYFYGIFSSINIKHLFLVTQYSLITFSTSLQPVPLKQAFVPFPYTSHILNKV